MKVAGGKSLNPWNWRVNISSKQSVVVKLKWNLILEFMHYCEDQQMSQIEHSTASIVNFLKHCCDLWNLGWANECEIDQCGWTWAFSASGTSLASELRLDLSSRNYSTWWPHWTLYSKRRTPTGSSNHVPWIKRKLLQLTHFQKIVRL